MTDVDVLREALKPQLSVVPTGRTDVPRLTAKQARKDLMLPRRAATLLGARSVGEQDRSARLYELASLLRDAGADPDATYTLLQGSVWNKFSGRDDEVERLWEAVERSRAMHNGKVPRRSAVHRRRLRSTSVRTLLAQPLKPPEWAVERIWGHQQYGFLAGEPKTYKSTIATDLAVSVATGTPFLGHFPVQHPGSVLIVQEENTKQIQQGRFMRILRERECTGKFHSFSSGVLEFTPPTDCPIRTLDRTGFNFTNAKKRKALYNEVTALRPALLIIDPLQMVMGNLSLRDETDVAKAFSWLNELSNETGCGILIVHHYHKRREDGPQLGGQRMLGSQALHAWLECGLYVQRIHGSKLKINREFRAFTDHLPFEIEFESEDDEDVYKATVHEEVRGSGKAQNALYDLVAEHPGKTAIFYAEKLDVSKERIGQLAKKLELQEKRAKSKSGGRPRTVYFMPRDKG